MCKKNKRIKVGRFELEEWSYGVRVYDNGVCVGRIDGAKAYDLSEEEIEELMFGDFEDDDDNWADNYGEIKATHHELRVEFGSI